MKIIYWNPDTSLNEEIAASIGFFDGVHKGHRFLIKSLQEQARNENLPSALITFPEHPRKVLGKTYQPDLLNTLDEKLSLLSALGLDYCIVLPFSLEMSKTTAADFIRNVLCERLKVKTLLIGYDHRFGKDRSEGFEQYAAYGQSCGMSVVQAPAFEEKEQRYSSTVIRHLLEEGNIRQATSLLSYNYSLEGKVKAGNQIGRTIGFPTANIEVGDKDKLIPREGVYAVKVQLSDASYTGMLYIGRRPTVANTKEKRIEVNIFDFDQDIYGERIRIEFVDFIREDKHFHSLEELQTQLQADKKAAEFIK